MIHIIRYAINKDIIDLGQNVLRLKYLVIINLPVDSVISAFFYIYIYIKRKYISLRIF